MHEPQTADRRARTVRLILILTAVSLPLAFYGLFRFALRRQIQLRLDAIRAEGYPATLAELNAWYVEPPRGENAADLYARAFAAIVPLALDAGENVPIRGSAELPAAKDGLPANAREAMAQSSADNRAALALLHEAARIEKCRYPIDLTRGWATDLSHLSRLRESARILAVEALLAADRGDGHAAAEALLAILACARSLEEEPLLIPHLARIACGMIAVDALEWVLSRGSLPDASLEQLDSALAAAEGRDSLTRAFAGERVMIDQIFLLSARELAQAYWPDPPGASAQPWITVYKAVGLAELDRITCLHIMTEGVRHSRMPVERAWRKWRQSLEPIETRLPRHALLSRMFVPGIGGVLAKSAAYIASLRAARTAVALERYRLNMGGDPPASLDQLVPDWLDAVPLDPFDGKPLRYRQLDPGYAVYSVGEDLTDHGGQPTRREPRSEIVFQVDR